MDFKWIKPGVPVIVPAPTPDAPPIAGIIVPPATDIALRTAHTTWQGGIAASLVGLLPVVGIHLPGGVQIALIAIIGGALAFVRSWLAHRKAAKMPKAP